MALHTYPLMIKDGSCFITKQITYANRVFPLIQTDVLPLQEMSVSEAAQYLGVGRKIIYQLIEYGELKAVRERGKIIIDPCSVQDFRAKGKMV